MRCLTCNGTGDKHGSHTPCNATLTESLCDQCGATGETLDVSDIILHTGCMTTTTIKDTTTLIGLPVRCGLCNHEGRWNEQGEWVHSAPVNDDHDFEPPLWVTEIK